MRTTRGGGAIRAPKCSGSFQPRGGGKFIQRLSTSPHSFVILLATDHGALQLLVQLAPVVRPPQLIEAVVPSLLHYC